MVSLPGSPVHYPSQRRDSAYFMLGLGLLLILAGILGLALSMLSRQANRSGHWFCTAQQSYNLADDALRQAVRHLEKSSTDGHTISNAIADACETLFRAMGAATQQSDPVVLLTSKNPASIPPALAHQLEAYKDLDPAVDVVAKIIETGPLWTGLLEGIPASSGERKGRVMIISKASMGRKIGVRVARSIILEREFRVVSLVPPLLGRFSLFVQNGPLREPNAVKVRFDPTTGDATPESGPIPLVVQSDVKIPLVAAGTTRLSRSALKNAVPDPHFIDHQGWLFLGGAGKGAWRLRAAHGYSGSGETPLLPGQYVRTLFHGSQSDDSSFKSRFAAGSSQGGSQLFDLSAPTDGLYYFCHGFASNYEIIGLDPSRYSTVQNGQGQRRALDCGSGETSLLRLFGTADEVSPTVVFGPVARVLVRKAVVQATRLSGGQKIAGILGNVRLIILRPSDHGARARSLLSSAFGSEQELEEHGSGVAEEPFSQALNLALETKGEGEYAPEGVLNRLPDTIEPVRFSSTLLPTLGTVPSDSGIPSAALERLWNGEMESASIYTGNLEKGFGAFIEALRQKVTVRLKGKDALKRLKKGTALRLPGVVLIDQVEPFFLGQIDRVETGGILITRGPIRIDGNILRGTRGEPLTVVSLAGNVSIGQGVNLVEAYLVALGGRVKFPAGPVTISGGVACRDFDLETLKDSPAARVIRYFADFDPVGPKAASFLRVFFGGEDKIIVGGEAGL